METANYLQNRLPTRSKTHGRIIPEETWTGRQQNLYHIRIFGSLVFCNISKEKRVKSDHQKVWERIFIGYSPNISKHFYIWAPQTKQIIIASKPYIDESEKRAKLLMKWPLDKTSSLKKKAPAGEPRPRGRPQKIISTEATILSKNNMPIMAEQTSNKEPEIAMSITKCSSKIRKPTIYDKAINDLIYGRRWREAIEEELQNLKNHQTCKYDELFPRQKAIELKWVFKVKYHPNGSVARFKVRLVTQGFFQVQRIDFSETFAPTVRRESLWIYSALCLMLNLFIHQMDIVGAYLESPLADNKLPIFMKLPPEMHNLC